MINDRHAEMRRRLLAQGCPADCIDWACDKHHRGCTHLGADHDEHECYWCVTLGPDDEGW